MHSRTKDDVAILDCCDVEAVLVEPLEEWQQVRAGLVALVRDALLVVRDAQRRLCVGRLVRRRPGRHRRVKAAIADAAPDQRGRTRATARCCARRYRRLPPPGREDESCVRPPAAPVRRLSQQRGASRLWPGALLRLSCGRAVAVRRPLTTTCAAYLAGEALACSGLVLAL